MTLRAAIRAATRRAARSPASPRSPRGPGSTCSTRAPRWRATRSSPRGAACSACRPRGATRPPRSARPTPAVEQIRFDGAHYRRDIGHHALDGSGEHAGDLDPRRRVDPAEPDRSVMRAAAARIAARRARGLPHRELLRPGRRRARSRRDRARLRGQGAPGRQAACSCWWTASDMVAEPGRRHPRRRARPDGAPLAGRAHARAPGVRARARRAHRGHRHRRRAPAGARGGARARGRGRPAGHRAEREPERRAAAAHRGGRPRVLRRARRADPGRRDHRRRRGLHRRGLHGVAARGFSARAR